MYDSAFRYSNQLYLSDAEQLAGDGVIPARGDGAVHFHPEWRVLVSSRFSYMR